MQNTIAKDALKGHTAVSLPRGLAAEVNAAADLSGRSPAKQLEHSFRIAQAIEQLLPTSQVHALKAGALPASQLLAGLAAVLESPSQSTAIAQIIKENPTRISFDSKDPSKATLVKQDGSVVQGRLLENGDFVADLDLPPASSVERATHAKPQKAHQSEKAVRKRRAAKVPEPA